MLHIHVVKGKFTRKRVGPDWSHHSPLSKEYSIIIKHKHFYSWFIMIILFIILRHVDGLLSKFILQNVIKELYMREPID